MQRKGTMQYAAINPSNSKYGSQTQTTAMTMNSSQQIPSEPSMMSSTMGQNANSRQQQQMAAQNTRNSQQKGSSAQPIPPRAGNNLSPLDRLKMI